MNIQCGFQTKGVGFALEPLVDEQLVLGVGKTELACDDEMKRHA